MTDTGTRTDDIELEALAGLTAETSYAEAVHRLLAVVRSALHMQVAWVSEFVGDHQVLRFVDADEGVRAPAPGASLPLQGSFCARVLDGRFPTLIPDARRVPEVSLLDVTAELQIAAYIGVPLLSPFGIATGMLCAVNHTPTPDLCDRDLVTVKLLAQLLHDMQERALSVAKAADLRRQTLRGLQRVIAGDGRRAVLQPIVDVTTGRAVAAEGLTRFDLGSPQGDRSPAQWFDDAARLGLRAELELAAAASVLDLLDGDLPPEVCLSVNLSPATLRSPQLAALLDGRPHERIVLEMTEHAPVTDYEALADALRPYRDRGIRVAIDDAGAGYASLQHVLAIAPDVIKVDMTLVRGCDGDLARRTLLGSLADFADATDCLLVAEGVETELELRTLAACGVHCAQGYYVARPSATPDWNDFPRA